MENLRNFCIFPNGDTLTKELVGGKHLWLPLELTKRPKMEMHNPVIVFNVAQGEVNGMSERFHQQAYYYSLAEESWRNPSLQLPVEAIERAYAYAGKAIDWGKEHNERFRQNHDRFLEQILEPGRTGYSRWLLRGLLYGSLLKVYRADLDAQRKNRKKFSNLFQKLAHIVKKL